MKSRGLKCFLIAVCVAMFAVNASAYDYKYRGCYRSFPIEYQSIDENNEPITLSAMVTVPLKTDKESAREIGFIMLNCPVFVSSDDERPTGDNPMDLGAARRIATDGALVVEPDGMGYGASYGKTVTMLDFKLAGRHMLDALFAAMDAVKAQGYSFSKQYYTYCSGYSLGGGYALATQRYVEQYLSDEEKAVVRLRGTICGGSPAVPRTVYENYLGMEKFISSQYVPMMLDNSMKIYRNGPLHSLQDAKLYSDTYLETGKRGNNIRDMVSDEMNDSTSAIFRGMMKTLEINSLASVWTPSKPVFWFHMEDDVLIPYKNWELCSSAWKGAQLRHDNNMMRDLNWNSNILSLGYRLVDILTEEQGWYNHTAYYIPFMFALIDGCARDTSITSTRLVNVSIPSQIEIVVDVFSSLKLEKPMEIPLDLINAEGSIVLNYIDNEVSSITIKNGDGTEKCTIDAVKDPDSRDPRSPDILYTITYPDGRTSSGRCRSLVAYITVITSLIL